MDDDKVWRKNEDKQNSSLSGGVVEETVSLTPRLNKNPI
jgi:hypothetical protein